MSPARLALLTVWGLLAPAMAAQATLSIVPLAQAMRNPDLLSADDDPKLEPARKAVSELLLNQPGSEELAGFHQRLRWLALHQDTRLGRLFFAALEALPGVENLPEGASAAGADAYFPLALGSGVQVRAAWSKQAGAFKVSDLSVTITGNAGALLSGAGPYFGSGEPNLLVLNALELDYLLGRDPGERMKLESERAAFDFDESLKKRFEAKAGEPAALLKTLDSEMRGDSPAADKLATLAKHMAEKPAPEELAKQAKDSAAMTQIRAQVEALNNAARPGSAPAFGGASFGVSATTPAGTMEWAIRRAQNGTLALSGTGLGANHETGK